MSDTAKLELPRSVMMEESLLASLLAHGESVSKEVTSTLSADDFTVNANRVLYAVIADVATEYGGISVDVVAHELDKVDGRLDGIGGLDRLRSLAADAPPLSNVRPTSTLLANLGDRRRSILTAKVCADIAADQSLSHAEAMAKIAQVSASLSERRNGAKMVESSAWFEDVYNEIEYQKHHGTSLRGIPSGLSDWDSVVSGIVSNTMYIIGGRPGAGKTAALTTMALHLTRSNVPVILFSLEMDRFLLGYRFFSTATSIDGKLIGTSNLTDPDLHRLKQAKEELRRLPLRIYDDPQVTPAMIESMTRNAVEFFKTKYSTKPVVMIDYLQIVKPDGKPTGNKTDILGDIAYACRNAVKKNGCAGILLAQLNRDIERREDKIPTNADIDGSGRIEQAADTITIIHNPSTDAETDPEIMASSIWRVTKNRYGRKNVSLKVGFRPQFCQFVDMAEGDGGW